MKATLPRLGDRRPFVKGIPQMKRTRPPATPQITPLSLTDQWRMTAAPKVWDVGAGPWSYQGKAASRPEYLCLKVLLQLGWRPEFQVNFLGGRAIPGGQVLDIVLNDHLPVVWIDVRSYYHFGTSGTYNDFLREAAVKAIMPEAKQIIVWERDVDQTNYLANLFSREIGYGGRGR